MAVLGCVQTRLRLRLKDGEELCYTINDLPEEVHGFRHSLTRILNTDAPQQDPFERNLERARVMESSPESTRV